MSSPSLVQGSGSPTTVTVRSLAVDHVGMLVLGAFAELPRIRDAAVAASGVRDHQVELPVRWIRIGKQCGAAADEAAVADRELDDRAVGEQRIAVQRDAQLGARGGDALEAGDQRTRDVADRAEELLERASRDGRLGADADVCDVDDHLVLAIDDQVDRLDVVGDDDPGRQLRVVRQSERRGEVVAGAEWYEPDDQVESVGLAQCRDHGVEAPVAAEHDDAMDVRVRSERVAQLLGCRRRDHLDLVRLAQRRDGSLDRLVVGGAGRAVGDREKGPHETATLCRRWFDLRFAELHEHDAGEDQRAAEELDRPRCLVEQEPREHDAGHRFAEADERGEA